MNKSPIHLLAILALTGLLGVCVCGSENLAAPGNQTQAPEVVVFDLHYRALTAPDDALNYRSYWGFGAQPPTDVPFIDAVKRRVQEFDTVVNSALTNAQWSVVELKDKKPVALYFDLNGDGELADNERILPATFSQSPPEHEFAFITPDFLIRQEDGREIPFRVMLVANSYGGDRMNYMWSPCCILEGQAVLGGAATRLFLYGNGFSGSFNTFGSCSFATVPLLQSNLRGFLSRATLSSLICHEGTFYRLSLEGSHEKDKTLKLKLQKDTSPTGRATVALKGKEAIKTRLTRATITGAQDPTIQFSMANAQAVIPVGRYKLASGYVCYGAQSDDEWQVNFYNGSDFTVAQDETTTNELGDLSMTISAVDERERYRSDVKEKSTYAKGTAIYLTPQIKGKAGEVYMRFSQKSAEGNRWTDVKPHVTILNADGKQVTSADMEYG